MMECRAREKTGAAGEGKAGVQTHEAMHTLQRGEDVLYGLLKPIGNLPQCERC